ncbi:MAG TPA: GNAT family N-acetyltransferase, partial [Actinocrinis sp.]
MTERIRPAAESDLDAMMALVAARERANARGGPSLFEALQAESEAGRVAALRRMMATDMERGGQVALVAEDEGRVVGFAVISGTGMLLPPLDDVSKVATLGEFEVAKDRWPTAGPALFGAALDAVRGRGAGMLMAQSLAPEAERRRLFESVGMRVTVETWWMPLTQRGTAGEGGGAAAEGGVRVRPAGAMDVDAMVALEAAHRAEEARRGSTFSSLFDGPAESRQRVLAEWTASPEADVLIAEADGRPVGYALVMDLDGLSPGLPAPTAAVNELAIEPERWPGAGRTLLHAALDAAERRGAEQILVMTETTDPAHGGDLTAAGLTRIAENWYTGVQQPQQR